MKDGFLRAACITPSIKVADCRHNAAEIIRLAKEAAGNGACLIAFPELCITGSTCGNLFFQASLLRGARDALEQICEETAELNALIIVGLPLQVGTGLYNAAAVLKDGQVLGYVQKDGIISAEEAYLFRTNDAVADDGIELNDRYLFTCDTMPELRVGVVFGDDLPYEGNTAGDLAGSGASVVVCLSALPCLAGAAKRRRELILTQSMRSNNAYLYVAAGEGESTTDMVYSGQRVIAECGNLLAESAPFTTGITYADLDLGRVDASRLRRLMGCGEYVENRSFDLELNELELQRRISPSPFIPDENLSERCEEILAIQTEGLAQRLRHTRGKCAVVGLSGGLDSTLALIVTVRAFDKLGLDRKGIRAITMPCFGTTSRTKGNAQLLAEAYGVSFMDIPIGDTVLSHFKDIGHDPADHSVTFENAQARERTQVLMDVANRFGGMVIGTGDLSELALGWATYNGDHMSMYGVNGGIPKTLVRHLTAYVASVSEDALASVLRDILDTPVSPELLPPVDGKISQCTEELVGPYELHDFFIFYALRYGYAPARIYRMAKHAFAGRFDDDTIKKWLTSFYRRFFAMQFKRSCLPDGPKVGSVGLSPRGDWRMPSDAVARLWVTEAEQL